MKRTDLEKRERELKRIQKRELNAQKRAEKRSGMSVGAYIDELFGRFRYDSQEIFNINEDVEILEILEDVKSYIPQKQWENIIKKAVRKTKVQNKEQAILELKELIGIT